MKNNLTAPTLFGDTPVQAPQKRGAEYDAFVEKFKPKKTTDDCYTPPLIFDAVLEYVGKNYDLTGKNIMRPFYPNGDFEALEYPADAVVIDNPPFSIVSKIAKFYTTRNIPFFIFAPHLTLFSTRVDCTHIAVGVQIIYENGAVVNTSFLSNMFGDLRVLTCSELYHKFKEIQDASKANLPKYVYPKNALTVSQLDKMIRHGIDFSLKKTDAARCAGLEQQKHAGKAMFGSGFLISEKAAAEKAAAEKDNVIVWELSPAEQKIIQSLGEAEK